MSLDTLTDELDPRHGNTLPEAKRLRIGNQSTVARTVRRAPEVMVKISSNAKNMAKVQKNVDYISRQGTVPLEDEQGNTYLGEHARDDALYTWGDSIPATGEKRRETFNVIFSMPKGTPRQEVTEATRRFIAKEFSHHQYLFATHNDEDHPHVHVIVKSTPLQGKRLHPNRTDLQRWREGFAEQLRGLGIEANTTPRAARGVTRKPEQQTIIHINERAKQTGKQARVTKAQEQAALDEINGMPKPEPLTALIESRKAVLTEYHAMVRALQKGGSDDIQLAGVVTRFVQSMPPVKTMHQQRVDELRAEAERQKGNELQR